MKDGINFNRPALLAAKQTARQRTLQASLGIAYVTLLGVLGVYIALHGYLLQRAQMVARTGVGNLRGLENLSKESLQPDPAFLELMRQVSDPERRWAPKLARLATLLPPNAWIVKLEAGSANTPLGDSKRHRLAINISATTRNEDEKILFPMRLVTTLQKDPIFAAGYTDIRFSSTRILTGSQAVVVNFDVECR